MATSKLVEAAVKATRLYYGSAGTVDIRHQQRLYQSMRKKIDALSKVVGQDVTQQISDEATKRGSLVPQPGRDI